MLRQYWRELDKRDIARADAAQVCNCGAPTVHHMHAANCWARPLPTMPFEVAGFTISKPLPYKVVDVPPSRWFRGGPNHVLKLTNALFKARTTRREMYGE